MSLINIAKYNNLPAGVYREIIDVSQRPDFPFNQSRLVIGFSRKGPFNRPILLNNATDLRKIFGERDEFLEKRGSFFHRTLSNALEGGPVYALNLRKLNPNGVPDLVDAQVIATDVSVGAHGTIQEIELSSLYKTDGYWIVDPEKMVNLVTPSRTNDGIRIANIGQETVTVFVTMLNDETFKIPASEWYGPGNIPSWMPPQDYISDYLVRVDIVKGNFGPSKYQELANDPIFGEFFTYSNNPATDGLIASKYSQFINSRYVEVKKTFTGSLIPGFRDQSGAEFYIGDSINAVAEETGIIWHINTDMFEGNTNPLNSRPTGTVSVFLSYKGDTNPTSSASIYTGVINGSPVVNTPLEFYVKYIGKPAEFADATSYSVDTIIEYNGIFYKVKTNHTSTISSPPSSNSTDYEVYTGEINATPAIKIGNFVKDATGGFVKVTDVILAEEGSFVSKVKVEAPADISSGNLFISARVQEGGNNLTTSTLDGFALDGFTWTSNHLPDGSWTSIKERILSVLVDTNIGKAITDRDTQNFRYLVDTFSKGIDIESKSIFTKLCAEKQNMIAILNAPSMKEFRNSTNPRFIDALGNLSTKLIREGGAEGSGTLRFTLPTQSSGGFFGAMYGPHLIAREGGGEKIIPPAGLISNLFVQKYSTAQPWTIIAGNEWTIKGGNVIGVEMELGKEDRLNFEKLGINPIVFKRGIGITIEGNATTKQIPKSSLSSINGIEVVIYIQDKIESILQQYQWKTNDETNRLQIKNLADDVCSQVQAAGGIFDYQNVIDRSNNTDDIIDNEIGVLNTYIEVAKGLRIIVNPLTVLRTGAIASGGIELL